jgi:hypothetical protein
MKLLALTFLTSTCYPAAGLQLRVLHSIWPSTAATNFRSACLLADPNLLEKLPSDIAGKILKENDKEIFQQEEAERKKRFKLDVQQKKGDLPGSARKMFEQHMPIECLKAGLCSTKIAYGFTLDKASRNLEAKNLHPKYSWENLGHLEFSWQHYRPLHSDFFLSISMDKGEIKEDYDLNRLIEEPHIKMLRQRGETRVIEELFNEKVDQIKSRSKLIACLRLASMSNVGATKE